MYFWLGPKVGRYTYMYMCIYMYICVYIHICIHMYMHMRIYIYVDICMYISLHMPYSRRICRYRGSLAARVGPRCTSQKIRRGQDRAFGTCSSDSMTLGINPEGSSTQYSRFLIPKTTPLMVFGIRVLGYRDPLGLRR